MKNHIKADKTSAKKRTKNVRKTTSRILTFFLSVLIMLSGVTPAFALTSGDSVAVNEKYLDAYYNTGNWYTNDGHMHNNYGQVAMRTLKSTGEPIYCLQIYNAVSGSTGTAGNIMNTNVWLNELTDTGRRGITRTSIYGYPNFNYGYSATDAYLATQILIWEFETGFRTNYASGCSSNLKSCFNNYPNALKCYNEIISASATHKVLPSFDNTTVELKGAGSSNSVTLTDTNNVLSKYTVITNDSRIQKSVSGNKLTIYSTEAGDISARLTFRKDKTNIDTALAINGLNQTLLYGTIADPVSAAISVKMSSGNLKIVKTSEDGIVNNVEFKVTGTNYSKTVKTDSTGAITLTDLPSGKYTVQESSVADKYAKPSNQTVTVSGGKTSTVTFNNALKKFNVTVNKVDSEKTQAQGEATLDGAVYGLYKDGVLLDEYTTSNGGTFTTSNYICGDGYTIKEITPSKGYLLDETTYDIEGNASNYTVESNSAPKITSNEDVIKGQIAIYKHSDLTDETYSPEKGAKFVLWLASAESYFSCPASEKDTITTDENGYGISKELPYGTYIVGQTAGLSETHFVDEFYVNITEDGKVYSYTLNNLPYTSHIKIIKTDIETGETIKLEGAGFQIYDSKNELVTFEMPDGSVVNTLYTGNDGTITTPQKLIYGSYKLVEVQAPKGYVLDDTPISFKISKSNNTVVLNVTKENIAQKGTITISKEGEIFSTVSQAEEIYTPVFEKSYLANAKFNIIAKEDIVTADGTVRLNKGQIADTITTNSEGVCKSKELYLGKYEIVEIQAPEGFILNTDKTIVELVYQGQNIAVTNTALTKYNERQKVQVSLNKVLEKDEHFQVGTNDEILNVSFALYANEDIVANDMTVIPKDGLIEVKHCDENGTINFNSDLPFGSYYIKEFNTDEHYILNDDTYEFTFNYDKNQGNIINIKINNGEEITNKIKRGTLDLTKSDVSTGELLAGVNFIVRDENGNEVAQGITDENGNAVFGDLPFGNYTYQEYSTIEGYVLDDTEFPFSITEDGQIVKAEMTNKMIEGTLKVIKTDDNGNKLEGVTFTVKNENEEIVAQGNTDENGIVLFENLKYGTYTVYEEEGIIGYIKSNDVLTFSIINNGDIIEKEFTNKMIIGSVKILKVDENDNPLSGVEFTVEDTNGNVITKVVTDKDGIANIEGLKYGEYVVYESKGIDGYTADSTKHNIKIENDGDIIELKFINNKIIEDIKSPETGGLNYFQLSCILLSSFAALCNLTFLLRIKRKKVKN